MEQYYAISESELKEVRHLAFFKHRKLEAQKMSRCNGKATYRLMTTITVEEE